MGPRVVVLGGGRIGTVHARNLAAAGAHVVVVEPDPSAGQTITSQLGLQVVADLATLEVGRVDGAVVCTPTDRHDESVRALLRFGVPILLEKPCCANPVASRALGAEVDRLGLPLRIGFQRRYAPEYRALRDLVRAGDERITLATFTSLDGAPPPDGYQVAGGSLAYDLQIHDVDLALWTFGTELSDIAAVQVELDGMADTLLTSLRYGRELVCSLVSKRTSGGGCEVYAEIVGERTTFSTRPLVQERRYADFRDRFEAAYRAEIRDFLNLIAGRPDTLAGWVDAAVAESVCHRIDSAAAAGRSLLSVR